MEIYKYLYRILTFAFVFITLSYLLLVQQGILNESADPYYFAFNITFLLVFIVTMISEFRMKLILKKKSNSIN